MSSDILFSILPREGKVPVTTRTNVKKVGKDGATKSVGEEEREQEKELRKVRNKEQYLRHTQENKMTENSEEELTEHDDEQNSPYRHFDIYI